MLNIVVPMAGAGSRFAGCGFQDPKPLIPVQGVPMIQLVIKNLRPTTAHRFFFICQRAHIAQYGLTRLLPQWAPNCEVIGVDGLTEGAACTVLAAQRFIDNADPLMIANSDQWVNCAIDAYLADMVRGDFDGYIMTMSATDPKWSFVGLDANGRVERVVEKQVISKEATVGIYNFRQGRDFVASAHGMIAQNQRVNGEFYVAPVYNSLIAQGQRVGIYNVGEEADGMHGLGTPADLALFLQSPVLARALAS